MACETEHPTTTSFLTLPEAFDRINGHRTNVFQGRETRRVVSQTRGARKWFGKALSCSDITEFPSLAQPPIPLRRKRQILHPELRIQNLIPLYCLSTAKLTTKPRALKRTEPTGPAE